MLGTEHGKAIEAAGFKSRIFKAYCRIFGVPDLHSHIRWDALRQSIVKDRKSYADVGAGGGYMTIEIAKKVCGMVHGICYDEKELNIANSAKLAGNVNNVQFIKGDILNLNSINQTFTQVFCIDVLEHIKEDERAIENLKAIMKYNGILTLSVPTPLYPKYFGRQFADMIGHARDGYSLPELRDLLNKAELEIIYHLGHTKIFGKMIGKFFYKASFLNRLPAVKLLIHPIFLLLAYLDKYTPSKKPVGLIVVARKTQGKLSISKNAY